MRHNKSARALRAFLGVGLLAPGLLVGSAYGVTQTADQGLALALVNLGCDDADDASYVSEFPGVTLEPRQPLARGEQVFGWRQTLQLPNHQRAVLERIAPEGHLRWISVEIRDSDSNPLLVVLADQDCSLTGACPSGRWCSFSTARQPHAGRYRPRQSPTDFRAMHPDAR